MKVRVRMYRQGLGDCFLVTFDPGGAEKHMLIDCGSLGATTTGVTLAGVVANIHATCKDHLDLVIATHEHWDHVRGFGELEQEFKKIKVDNVWMAWTENPKDKLAQSIAKTKKDLGTALEAAGRALQKAPKGSDSHQAGLAVGSLLGFYGEDALLGASKFSESVNDAMNVVRTGLTVPAQFFNPGDGPIEPAWLPGFRFYVLGPPRDEKKINDTGEHGSSELYGIAGLLRSSAKLMLSGKGLGEYLAAAPASAEAEEFESQLPFDLRYRFSPNDPMIRDAFRSSYFIKGEGWRNIDFEWLHCASDLALQLDSATNNTSLALAIERVSDGKVLLFPADAQQGNWLSWHDPGMKWAVKDSNGKSVEVTAADLLRRTVFYKVGHHSSHNATAKGKGLELMEQDQDLVAFIPVDRAVALKRNPPGSWKMPARPLYRRLLEKCQGRVMRSDLGWADDAVSAKDKAVEKEFVGMATAAEWTAWKKAQNAAAHVTISADHVEYLLA
jgi:hypothetical protein